MHTETVIGIISFLGTVSFAVSGAMASISKRADFFGVIILAVVTAVGGGIIRDILLGILPPKIFLDPSYLFLSASVAAAVYLFVRLCKDFYCRHAELIDGVNNIFDALGLGVFVVAGSQSAIDCGFLPDGFFVIFTGVITGVGGGFLRDIMICEIPFILKKRIYALAALPGAIIFYILYIRGINYAFAVFFGAFSTFFVRMLATYFRWDLPPAY